MQCDENKIIAFMQCEGNKSSHARLHGRLHARTFEQRFAPQPSGHWYEANLWIFYTTAAPQGRNSNVLMDHQGGHGNVSVGSQGSNGNVSAVPHGGNGNISSVTHGGISKLISR